MHRFSLYKRGRIYYCQFWNPNTGRYCSGISTGETNRDAAVLKVGEWQRDGIPHKGAGRRDLSETVHVDTILDAVRRANLETDDAERIVHALRKRQLIETAIVQEEPESEPFIAFLTQFRDYDHSPYIEEKTAHGNTSASDTATT